MNADAASTDRKALLSVLELGGYPNFTRLYERLGYEVTSVISVRKALRFLKTRAPDVVVAEFNFQSDFRDRTSSLDTLLGALQKYPAAKIIAFYERDYTHQFERLCAVYPQIIGLTYPIEEDALERALAGHETPDGKRTS